MSSAYPNLPPIGGKSLIPVCVQNPHVCVQNAYSLSPLKMYSDTENEDAKGMKAQCRSESLESGTRHSRPRVDPFPLSYTVLFPR